MTPKVNEKLIFVHVFMPILLCCGSQCNIPQCLVRYVSCVNQVVSTCIASQVHKRRQQLTNKCIVQVSTQIRERERASRKLNSNQKGMGSECCAPNQVPVTKLVSFPENFKVFKFASSYNCMMSNGLQNKPRKCPNLLNLGSFLKPKSLYTLNLFRAKKILSKKKTSVINVCFSGT